MGYGFFFAIYVIDFDVDSVVRGVYLYLIFQQNLVLVIKFRLVLNFVLRHQVLAFSLLREKVQFHFLSIVLEAKVSQLVFGKFL